MAELVADSLLGRLREWGVHGGCCGLAGAFGFAKDHYELSIACGERVALAGTDRRVT